MNNLYILNSMGFKISWKLINVGLYGNGEIPVSLTYDDVLEYLDSLLIDIDEPTDNIITLICNKDDRIKFDRLLKGLANEDDSNIIIQKRKWRACLLKNLIDNASEDCLQGMLELMEFWLFMDNPIDCPQTFPSGADQKSIQDYFTQASYELNLSKNLEWLNEEIRSIVKLED